MEIFFKLLKDFNMLFLDMLAYFTPMTVTDKNKQ